MRTKTAILIAAGACPAATRPKDVPVKTSLCEATRNPWRFACRQIVFRAIVNSDCLENSALVDDNCGAAPISPSGPDSPAIVNFFHGLCSGPRFRFAVELLDVRDASPGSASAFYN